MITGVVPIIHDMCVDTCVGFTGPFDALDACPKCSQPRYHPGTKNGRRQFSTIPIGPVIQALYRSEETAELMHYLEEITEKILQHAKENGGVTSRKDIDCFVNFTLNLKICMSVDMLTESPSFDKVFIS